MSNGSDQGAVDIVIPVCNNYPRTRTLLEGIYLYSDLPFHLYVVDNASTDETADLSKIYARDITVVRNRENRGWQGGFNQGIELGRSPTVVCIKNEVEVSQGWLGNLVAFLQSHPRIGAVGPLNSDPGNWQCVDRVRADLVPEIPPFLTDDLHERNRILAHHFHRAGILVEGILAPFCLALQRRGIRVAGPLDESDDYCRRLRKAGYVLGLSLDTYVTHHVNSGRQAAHAAERAREMRRPTPSRVREKRPNTAEIGPHRQLARIGK